MFTEHREGRNTLKVKYRDSEASLMGAGLGDGETRTASPSSLVPAEPRGHWAPAWELQGLWGA